MEVNLFPSCIPPRRAMGVNTVPPSRTCLRKATAEAIAAVKSVSSEKGANVPKTPVQNAANFVRSIAPQPMNVRGPGFRPQKEEKKLRGAHKNLGSHALV